MTLTDAAHPADVSLLAVLHQQPLVEAPAIREHVAACARCSARWRELSDEDAATAELLGALDHPFPADSAPTWLRPRRLRRTVLTAAATATLVVAAAATIVPGSPLHRRPAVRHEAVPPHATLPGTPPPAIPVAPLASGISIHAPRGLTVRFLRDQHTGVIEIARSGSAEVTFRSRGGTTAYRLGAGEVSLDNQVPAEAYLIDLSASVRRLRILVGRRLVLRWPEDSVRLTSGRDSSPVRIVLDLARRGVP